MVDVSGVEGATSFRGFHHDGTVDIHVDADTVDGLVTATDGLRVEGQSYRGTDGVTPRHVLISHGSGRQPHRQQFVEVDQQAGQQLVLVVIQPAQRQGGRRRDGQFVGPHRHVDPDPDDGVRTSRSVDALRQDPAHLATMVGAKIHQDVIGPLQRHPRAISPANLLDGLDDGESGHHREPAPVLGGTIIGHQGRDRQIRSRDVVPTA